MKFYEFGGLHKPVIILLPGICCHWKANFEEVIPFLTKKFRVVCVSYDGFDETEKMVFPDMVTETKKIEKYIKGKYDGKIYAAYGSSLGGSFVGLLVQRGNIHIKHAILGSSDLYQEKVISAKLKAWLIGKIVYGMFQKGKLPGFMKKRLAKKTADERLYYDKVLDMFGMNNTKMDFVKKESIQNQFYFDLVTPIKNGISVSGTTVHIFYAVKMGKDCLYRYFRHFEKPDIRYHDMLHEELLICFPEQWAEDVIKCCEL